MIVGTQVVALGLCAHAYGTYFMGEKDPWFDRMRARFRLEHGLAARRRHRARRRRSSPPSSSASGSTAASAQLSEERLAILAATLHDRRHPGLLLVVPAQHPRPAPAVNATLGAQRQAPAGAEAVARSARARLAGTAPPRRPRGLVGGGRRRSRRRGRAARGAARSPASSSSARTASRPAPTSCRSGRACGCACLRQRVPDGTGRIRFKIDSQTRAPAELPAHGAPAGRARRSPGASAASAGGFRFIDIPLDRPLPGRRAGRRSPTSASRPGDTGGPVFAWGTSQLGNTDRPVRAGPAQGRAEPGRALVPAQGAAGAQHPRRSSGRSSSGRRSSGRGSWGRGRSGSCSSPPSRCCATPACGCMARADEPRARRVPLPVWVALLGFGAAITWSFVTPAFQSPDESEHFGAVQWFGETGRAVDAVAGQAHPVVDRRGGRHRRDARAVDHRAAGGQDAVARVLRAGLPRARLQRRQSRCRATTAGATTRSPPRTRPPTTPR